MPTITTAEELLSLREPSYRHELVRGELRRSPFLTQVQGQVVAELAMHLGDYARSHAIGRVLPGTGFLIERHPEGSQAFVPMTEHPFLVIVSPDPQAKPRAFLTNGAQGINLYRGTWHGVLTPLHAPGIFAVIDRIGTTPNLEEHRFATPWTVLAP